MGCICSKGGDTAEYNGNQREKGPRKSSRRLVTTSRREEVIVEADSGGGNDGRERLISKSQENVLSTPLSSDGEKKAVIEKPIACSNQTCTTSDVRVSRGEQSLRIFNVPNGIEGEQIAAGWPSWLTAVAGEAIKGWLPRRADSFEKLDKVSPTLCYFTHFICKTLQQLIVIVSFCVEVCGLRFLVFAFLFSQHVDGFSYPLVTTIFQV